MTDNENTALYAFRRYGDTVLRAAYASTGSLQEAEDITQEVFLKLHSTQTEFADNEHMKAWLLRAAVNLGRNYRKSFRFSRTSSIEDVGENQLSSDFTTKGNEIRESIAALPQKYSEVIFLYYYEGYNIREISGLLGKSENTVSSLLQRGRKKLRIELEKEDNYGSERV